LFTILNMGTPVADTDSMAAVLQAIQTGDLDSIEDPLRQNVENTRKEHGDQHVDTAQSLFILGMMLNNLGKGQEAVAHLYECYEIRKNLLGTRDSSTAVTLRIVAGLEMDNGMISESEAHFRECIEMAKSNLGKESMMVLELQNLLVSVLERSEQLDRLEIELRTLADLLKIVKGPGHEDTIDALVLSIHLIQSC
jgi:hypothetical protein